MIDPIGLKVMEVMSLKPLLIEAHQSITACAQRMQSYNTSALLVTQDGEFIGLITYKQIIQHCVAKGYHPDQVIVRDFMLNSMPKIPSDSDLNDALDLMQRLNVNHLVVQDKQHRCIGIITIQDILSLQPEMTSLLQHKQSLKDPTLLNSDIDYCSNCKQVTDELFYYRERFLCRECRDLLMQKDAKK